MLILTVFTFLLSQNEVCFDVLDNPYPNDPALISFTKYINVLDCIDIYAESQISDNKILHAAAIAAELKISSFNLNIKKQISLKSTPGAITVK